MQKLDIIILNLELTAAHGRIVTVCYINYPGISYQFHRNQFKTCRVMLLTNRQTNSKHYWKHNLLIGDNECRTYNSLIHMHPLQPHYIVDWSTVFTRPATASLYTSSNMSEHWSQWSNKLSKSAWYLGKFHIDFYFYGYPCDWYVGSFLLLKYYL